MLYSERPTHIYVAVLRQAAMEAKHNSKNLVRSTQAITSPLKEININIPNLPEWVDLAFILASNPKLKSLLADSKALASEIDEFKIIELIIGLSGKPNLVLNKWFDVQEYERIRPDVARASVNSTYHYFTTNGPRVYPNLSGDMSNINDYIEKKKVWETLSHSFDKEEILKTWTPANQKWKVNSSSELIDAIERSKKEKLIITISHDDAYSNSGGIQKIIRQETADSLSRNDICYVHMSPAQAAPFAVDFLGNTQVVTRVRVNGTLTGYFLLKSAFNSILDRYLSDNLYLFIHHFYGFPLADISYYTSFIARRNNAYLWIHDYSSQCNSYTLLRDGMTQCSSPPPNSSECSFCAYGASRHEHLKYMYKLFNIKGMKYIIPSEASKEVLFQSHLKPVYDNKVFVRPHLSISDISLEKKLIDTSIKRLRIAYIGYPASHKGWIEFEALTKSKALSHKVEWFHFGKGNTGPSIHSKYFDGTQDRDIIEIIRSYKIDFAIVWPLWQETFCFVGFEAALSGCHILTNSFSGNVANSDLPSEVKTIFTEIKQLYNYLLKVSNNEKHEIDVIKSYKPKESNYSLGFVS